jgi:hypothetical protein
MFLTKLAKNNFLKIYKKKKKHYQNDKMEWNVKIYHTYHEANRCADALVHIGCELGYYVIFYESCPTQIMHIFLDDKAEIST